MMIVALSFPSRQRQLQVGGASFAFVRSAIHMGDEYGHDTTRARSRSPTGVRVTYTRVHQRGVIDVHLDPSILDGLSAFRRAEAQRRELHDRIDQRSRFIDSLDSEATATASHDQRSDMVLMDGASPSSESCGTALCCRPSGC